MAAHAVRGVAGELDHLLPEQRRLADQRHVEALLPRLAQKARAFLFVRIDEHGVGVRAFDLDDVGGEVDLAGFRRDVGDDGDVALLHLGDEEIAAALAEVVVDPHHRDLLRLDAVAHVVGDLGHRELLAERGAEDVSVAALGDGGGFGAGDLGDLGLLGELHGHQHRAGEHRPEYHVGVVVDHLLDLHARNAGVALGVDMRHIEFLAENAALGVDFLDGERDAITPIRSGHRAGAGQFDDIGNIDARLRRTRRPARAAGRRPKVLAIVDMRFLPAARRLFAAP